MTKFWKSLLVAFLLGLGLHPLQAQQTLLPVLNPAQFLADGVTRVESKPILHADDSAHTFSYFDGAIWKTYPYPQGMSSLGKRSNFDARSDGTYVIYDQNAKSFINVDAAHYWIFDPHDRTFAHIETACGRVKDLSGEGQWVLYRASENALFGLCFTETGEIKPLSVEFHPEQCNYFDLVGMPLVSPDKQWLIFAACQGDRQPTQVYAYHLADDELVYLGAGAALDHDFIDVDQWIDNTHPILNIYSGRNPAFFSVFTADLTQADSLQLVVNMLSQWPLTFPDHLEWFPSSSSGMPGPDQPGYCQLHRFDLKTETETVFPEISGVCNGYPIPDGTGDYLGVSFGDWKTGKASLLRFNPVTGQKRDLLDGEIEWLQSISPDGRYALLIMDNDGKIEYGYYWEPEQYSWDQDPSAWTAIFDLQTGKVVYTVPGVANVYYGYSSYTEWLDADRLLVSTDGLVEFKPLTNVSLVDLRAPVTVTPIEGGVHKLDNGWLLIQQDSGSNAQISLYDISTRKLTPITYLWDSQQYNVRIVSQGDNFEMTINDATSREGLTLADWIIHVA